MKKAFTAAITAIALAFSVPSYADRVAEFDEPAYNAIYDVLLMRPFGLVATGVGAVVFIIGLPITLPLGEAGRSAHELVAVPFNYTFTRPIGDMMVEESQEWEKERRREEAERRHRYPSQDIERYNE